MVWNERMPERDLILGVNFLFRMFVLVLDLSWSPGILTKKGWFLFCFLFFVFCFCFCGCLWLFVVVCGCLFFVLVCGCLWLFVLVCFLFLFVITLYESYSSS